MMNIETKYFLNRSDYHYKPFANGGLSGKKNLAVPKNGIGASYVIKSFGKDCACNEFVGLRLAKLLGIAVPDAFLVLPKKDTYEVAIEYLHGMPKPSLDYIQSNKNMLHSYVSGAIVHCLFDDLDATDFLNCAGELYTFDFADGFLLDDFMITVMESHSDLSRQFPAEFLNKFTSPIINYDPKTLLLYEMLVNDLHVCDKEYFDSCLDEICSKFLTIPDNEIKGILDALGKIYPSSLAMHFVRYIGEIKKFCRE